MSDLLRMDYINSLPQPLMAREFDGSEWPVDVIDVQTGCMRLDICGKIQHTHISNFSKFIDQDGNEHDVDTFYSDFEESSP